MKQKTVREIVRQQKIKPKPWPQNLKKKELIDELLDLECKLDQLDCEVWELRLECERRKIDLTEL